MFKRLRESKRFIALKNINKMRDLLQDIVQFDNIVGKG
jgi:predicted nucleotide-binding protein (sugar kinase/HSP70/actin superfamily)